MDISAILKILRLSAIHAVLGLLWLSVPVFLNLSYEDDVVLKIIGLILWFFVFVFFPVFFSTLLIVNIPKLKTFGRFLRTRLCLYLTILLLLAYCFVQPHLNNANDIYLDIFLFLINLFALCLTIRKIPDPA